MENKTFVCCICGGYFMGYGNNPDGACWKDEKGKVVMPTFKENDRCCNDCDNRFVIPGRIYRMQMARKNRG